MRSKYIPIFSFLFLLTFPIHSYADTVILSNFPSYSNTVSSESVITDTPTLRLNDNKITDAPKGSNTVYIESETKPETSYTNAPIVLTSVSGPGISLSYANSIKKNDSITTGLRADIVNYAKQFVGGKYVYGGTSLTDGVDCSGFVMRVFEKFGINTGRDSRSQAAKSKRITADELLPGDLIFYASGDYINHVAIYIGNSKVIHAASSSEGIIISDYSYREPYLFGRFVND